MPYHGEQIDIIFEPCLQNENIVIGNTNEPVAVIIASVLHPKLVNRKKISY